MPSTTLGYERLANWAFAVESEDEFVRQVLSGQPEPPAYFALIKPFHHLVIRGMLKAGAARPA